MHFFTELMAQPSGGAVAIHLISGKPAPNAWNVTPKCERILMDFAQREDC